MIGEDHVAALRAFAELTGELGRDAEVFSAVGAVLLDECGGFRPRLGVKRCYCKTLPERVQTYRILAACRVAHSACSPGSAPVRGQNGQILFLTMSECNTDPADSDAALATPP